MSRPFGKHFDFRDCNCTGLEETLTEVYDMLDTLADEKVLSEDQFNRATTLLRTGQVPFDGIKVGNAPDAKVLDHVNMYSLDYTESLDIPAGGSAKLALTLPPNLTALKRGTGISGYLKAGHTAYDDHATANVDGLFVVDWTIVHAATAPTDFNGTLTCRVFNVGGTSTIDIPTGVAEVMLFIPRN